MLLRKELKMTNRKVIEKIKNKDNKQIVFSIVFIGISILITALLWCFDHTCACCWAVGILIGIVLRSSRFCFASAFRDIFVARNTKLLRAVLIAMMVSSVGFAVIQYNYIKQNKIIYDMIPGTVTSVGLHVMIGAFLFGVGMVIAGGCSSSVLMRIGEGHSLHWVVLIGFFIGTAFGAKDYGFWYDKIIKHAKVIYFPEYMDIRIVLGIQLILLIGIYRVVYLYEKKHIKE